MRLLTVTEIRESFLRKPDDYKISDKPDRESVRAIRNNLIANLRDHPCDVEGSGGDWRFLILRPDGWQELSTEAINPPPFIGADGDTLPPHAVPPLPTVTRPGPFVSQEGWTHSQYLMHKDRHDKAEANFILFTRYRSALLQDIKAAVPEALLAEAMDREGIFHQDPSQVLTYLEDKFDNVRPQAINITLRNRKRTIRSNSM